MYPFWYGCKHDYGYPAGNVAVEPDVLFQVTMEPTGTDLVDVVQGITLAEIGSPTYDQVPSGGGIYGLLKPGISYPVADDRHEGQLTGELDLAVGVPITVEFWVQGTGLYDLIHPVVAITDTSGFLKPHLITLFSSEGLIVGSDPVFAFWFWNGVFPFTTGIIELPQSVVDLSDGEPHHVRGVYHPTDPSGSLVAIDGTTYITQDLTQYGTEPTAFSRITVGGLNDPNLEFDNNYFPGDVFEVRVSGNATNDSYNKR